MIVTAIDNERRKIKAGQKILASLRFNPDSNSDMLIKAVLSFLKRHRTALRKLEAE